MRTFKKILKWTLLATGGLTTACALAIVVFERRTHDPGFPAITASQDPGVIARGRYLAHGPAHCVDCHGSRDGQAPGAETVLSGGTEWHLPIGIIRSPNLTSDPETGLGAVTDGQIARALRHGVRRDGRALAPFMAFGALSDEDLTAIVSYLRTLPPVRKPVETRALNVLGHAVAAFALEPTTATTPPPARVEPGPTVAYGEYLVTSVANCAGCHTTRDMRTGKYTGAPLSGGQTLESHEQPGRRFVTPNLTPDPRTGRLTTWNEETFVARFRTGGGAEGSPMPWKAFSSMSDEDLLAIFRYLRTVPPVENDTGPSVLGEAVAAR
jgi:mono/diheme cytochrome c family protein